MTGEIKVNQADREAAANLNGYANWSVFEAAPQHSVEWMELCAHDFARHCHQVRAYWYRQGKDDGWQMCRENEIDRLREELAEAYVKLSGKSIHTSDCATSYAPAMEPGPCNCDAPGDADLVAKLRDTDSYYRLQEKHWCIDGEELERQRLAAADRIERLTAALDNIANESSDAWAREKARAALAGDSHDQ